MKREVGTMMRAVMVLREIMWRLLIACPQKCLSQLRQRLLSAYLVLQYS